MRVPRRHRLTLWVVLVSSVLLSCARQTPRLDVGATEVCDRLTAGMTSTAGVVFGRRLWRERGVLVGWEEFAFAHADGDAERDCNRALASYDWPNLQSAKAETDGACGAVRPARAPAGLEAHHVLLEEVGPRGFDPAMSGATSFDARRCRVSVHATELACRQVLTEAERESAVAVASWRAEQQKSLEASTQRACEAALQEPLATAEKNASVCRRPKDCLTVESALLRARQLDSECTTRQKILETMKHPGPTSEAASTTRRCIVL